MPETLIEAELFGHEAGAFTGATKARPGRFEEANGGTLFLDELATLSSPAQDRLLRAIEYGEVTRIGSSRPVQVDVRIVAATNEHLPRLVEEGRFRADLLDRLSFEVVTLPPLRDRQSDIPVLAEFFGRRMALELEMGRLARLQRRARWRGCRPMTGRAMCANCATWSNAPSIAGPSWRARSSDIQFDPFESPWRPAGGAGRPQPRRPCPSRAQPAGAALPALAPAPAATAASIPTPAPTSASPSPNMKRRSSPPRSNAAAGTSARRRRRSSLTYDQLRHAMRRHELQG